MAEQIREGFQTSASQPVQQAAQQAAPNGGGGTIEPPSTATTPASVNLAIPINEWPIKVRLMHKPIRGNNGEEVRELSFREPSGADINRYGNPCRLDSNTEMQIDEIKMTRIIAALSGILYPMIEAMDTRDWNSCAYRLSRFFLPSTAGW